MIETIGQLENEMIKSLSGLNQSLTCELNNYKLIVKNMSEENAWLKEQIAWFKKQMFGQKSDKIVKDLDQTQPLLEGLEMPAETAPEQKTETVAEHARVKRVKKGEGKTFIEYPEDLPVVRNVIDIPEEEKKDPESGEELVHIRDEVSRKLAMKEAQFYIIEHVRPVWAKKSCPEDGVKTAYMPDHPIEKSPADVSVIAHVIVGKCADHLPLYRMQEQFARQNVRISRQTMSNWLICAGKMLSSLRDLMLEKILASGSIFVDETPVKMIVKGLGRCRNATMWVYVGGGGADPPYKVYDFCLDRKYANPMKVLKNFKGHMHSDQYGAYIEISKNEGVFWDPCMTHIRRKFVDAEAGDPEFRTKILRKINNLFRFERIAWSRTPEERVRIRVEKEEPIIDEMTAMVRERLLKGGLLPKSDFRNALEYYMTAAPFLKNYLRNPDARLDNNPAERALRPFVIGKKNWLFVGSGDGGRAMATLLSLVQTCRALGINPTEYLEDVLRRIMGHSAKRLDELLPDKWKEARQNPAPGK